LAPLRGPEQFLVFELDGRRLAVPSRDIVEIVRMPTLTPLPRPLPIVEGVVNFRGRLASVLDIRKRFGIAAKAVSPQDHLLVASLPSRLVALRVDRTVELVSLAGDEIADPGCLAPHDRYVSGVAKHPDGLIVIHDLGTFLSAAEGEELDRSLALEPPP
jgi:purine-binding chemotaxis protein CheW